MDSGIYFHAPEHGRPTWNGMQIHIFQQEDAIPAPQSMGAIFPVFAPLKVNVKNKGEWNSFRILMDWPRLRVWTNEEMIHDLDVSAVPELRHRFRRGYLGFDCSGKPHHNRNHKRTQRRARRRAGHEDEGKIHHPGHDEIGGERARGDAEHDRRQADQEIFERIGGRSRGRVAPKVFSTTAS